jgi:hypothetical protein
MPGSTLLGEPLAETAQSDTRRLPYNHLRVLKTALDNGPELVDVRADKLAAALDRYTERHERRLAHTGISSHVHLKLVGEDGEDLLWWKGLGEIVEYAEGKLRVSLVLTSEHQLTRDGESSSTSSGSSSQPIAKRRSMMGLARPKD